MAHRKAFLSAQPRSIQDFAYRSGSNSAFSRSSACNRRTWPQPARIGSSTARSKCPRVRHPNQLHILIFESLAEEAVLDLGHSPSGTKRSSPDQEPATRCAAGTSLPKGGRSCSPPRQGSDRIRSPVAVEWPTPSADRCHVGSEAAVASQNYVRNVVRRMAGVGRYRTLADDPKIQMAAAAASVGSTPSARRCQASRSLECVKFRFVSSPPEETLCIGWIPLPQQCDNPAPRKQCILEQSPATARISRRHN